MSARVCCASPVFFFQAEDGIRDLTVTGVQTCALPIFSLAVVGILTAAVVVGLPMIVPAFDFEASAGMMLAIPVWFVSGMLVGLISPGRSEERRVGKECRCRWWPYEQSI